MTTLIDIKLDIHARGWKWSSGSYHPHYDDAPGYDISTYQYYFCVHAPGKSVYVDDNGVTQPTDGHVQRFADSELAAATQAFEVAVKEWNDNPLR